MGAEFRTLIIPRDNTWRPDASACRRLFSQLREARYLPRAVGAIRLPGSLDETPFDETDDLNHMEFIVRWEIGDRRESDLRHPLMEIVEADEQGVYYDVKFHFAEDFVETASEIIAPPAALCACGEDLTYDPQEDIFYAGRIRRVCPACGEGFRPQDYVADYVDGITGESSELPGGATYRFAIIIGCGKHWRTSHDKAPEATSSFLSTASNALGVELYEVGEFY